MLGIGCIDPCDAQPTCVGLRRTRLSQSQLCECEIEPMALRFEYFLLLLLAMVFHLHGSLIQASL